MDNVEYILNEDAVLCHFDVCDDQKDLLFLWLLILGQCICVM